MAIRRLHPTRGTFGSRRAAAPARPDDTAGDHGLLLELREIDRVLGLEPLHEWWPQVRTSPDLIQRIRDDRRQR